MLGKRTQMKLRFALIFFAVVTLAACTGLRKVDLPKKYNAPAYTQSELDLIMSDEGEKPMRVFLTTSKSDSMLLRQKSRNVVPDKDDKVLERFTQRLYATVRDPGSLGVGIAAPQVGLLRNIIWVQRFDKEGFPFEVYLNPKIVQYSTKKQPCPEGCLSIPNKRDTTQNRSYAILLEYDKMDGSHQIEMVEDFTAVIFQHEIDHLNGILFTDHLEKHRKED